MAAIRVAILGAGRPGVRHAEGFKAAGGFEIAAVADLIPQRRKTIMEAFGVKKEVADALDVMSDAGIDAVSICLPNHLHLPVAVAALRAKKHVICETPPTLSASEARKLLTAAAKYGRTVLFAAQRRFGGAEQAAKQAVDKGYIGDAYHARAAWMRTRGIPVGSGEGGVGWYFDPSKSGGGVVLDLGVQMLDLAHDLLGRPRPVSVFATMSDHFHPAGRLPAAAVSVNTAADDHPADDSAAVSSEGTGDGSDADATTPSGAAAGPSGVEDTFFALMKFEGGKTLELSSSWAINQPPTQNGTICRVHGTEGAVDVYTRQGPVLHRKFSQRGDSRETPLKTPKVTHYHAMMRHFRECIQGKAQPLVGPDAGALLMAMVDAIYKSAETGKSVDVR
ncbi:Gfo/Idh/MocA family protein [Humisphaera borealis]|uniref:Gfo/Idh/MocA family oxidoreductase n=1 Tax=Humisphaera borealis TaxID=2807512 RepID=A0A7M2X117_9BACT|nr:Gfo/Idh/MocA family oxidoreductase [Humisphaera borealis]QOV90430.1 Gfo/Idh/MocA family oxidoreductase [Humisphaera borealis]